MGHKLSKYKQKRSVNSSKFNAYNLELKLEELFPSNLELKLEEQFPSNLELKLEQFPSNLELKLEEQFPSNLELKLEQQFPSSSSQKDYDIFEELKNKKLSWVLTPYDQF